MGKSNNYGLPPTVDSTCPKCKSQLEVFQRWVPAPANEPPSCPVCRGPFLTRDEGRRVNSQTKQEYKQSYAIEYYLIRVLRRGPEQPAAV